MRAHMQIGMKHCPVMRVRWVRDPPGEGCTRAPEPALRMPTEEGEPFRRSDQTVHHSRGGGHQGRRHCRRGRHRLPAYYEYIAEQNGQAGIAARNATASAAAIGCRRLKKATKNGPDLPDDGSGCVGDEGMMGRRLFTK
uniref:Ig-like domain-containing protein n=1 Tax=Steinernema glaseri TaxID=37863 RepID=A0A1I7ZN28_9BILA